MAINYTSQKVYDPSTKTTTYVKPQVSSYTDTGTGKPAYTNPQQSLADRGFTVTQRPDGTTSYSHEIDNTKKSSGSGYAPASTGGAVAPAQLQEANFTPADVTAYENAKAKLQNYSDNPFSYGQYESQFDADLAGLYDKILNRDKFQYDLNADALYQQYRDQYVQQGQNAMRNAMGQASALTGGYGSSYGQAVGQQQYGSYLQNLNDIVPELYDRAYQQYSDNFNRDLTAYQTAYEADNNAYNRWNNEYNHAWDEYTNDRDYWTNRYDTEYAKLADEAQNRASLGDYGAWASLYGDESARNAYATWAWQNEDLARKLGYIK